MTTIIVRGMGCWWWYVIAEDSYPLSLGQGARYGDGLFLRARAKDAEFWSLVYKFSPCPPLVMPAAPGSVFTLKMEDCIGCTGELLRPYYAVQALQACVIHTKISRRGFVFFRS